MTDAADTKPAGRPPSRPAAAIIPFPARARTSDAVPTAGPARILLFTGVRYERLPEADTSAVAPGSDRRPRAPRARPAAPARRRQPS